MDVRAPLSPERPAPEGIAPVDPGPQVVAPVDPGPEGPTRAPDAGHGRPRLRLRYTKEGRIRFISQRDVARVWERTMRRSGLPLSWSEGFSPHLLLSFGLGLPTGCASGAEYLDVHLSASPGVPPQELPGLLSDLLPEGMEVVAAALVAGGSPSLQHLVTSCTWELEVLGVAEGELAEQIERFLALSSVPVQKERKGRLVEADVRPMVRMLEPLARRPDACGTTGARLRAELGTQPQGVRPNELLVALGGGLTLLRARRTHQWIEQDSARYEPLPLGGQPELSRPRTARGAL